MNTQINFPKSEFNLKCNNLLSNGFEEYLITYEDGITHSIFTNTIEGHIYNRWIVDIWDNGKIEYSKQ
jgi:hypothetical protein